MLPQTKYFISVHVTFQDQPKFLTFSQSNKEYDRVDGVKGCVRFLKGGQNVDMSVLFGMLTLFSHIPVTS